MGTRGGFGFRVDGQDKIAYRQFDSYPSGGGEDVAAFVRKHRRNGVLFKNVVEKIRKIEVVNEDVPPTREQINRFRKYADTNVSTGKLTEWYVLLRNLQGDLAGYADAGVILDASDFLKESLFCEWAYIVNLDTNKLEVYEGFQKERGKGRYAEVFDPSKVEPRYPGDKSEYWPVSLIAEIDFADVPQRGRFEKYLHDIGALKEDDEGAETLNSVIP